MTEEKARKLIREARAVGVDSETPYIVWVYGEKHGEFTTLERAEEYWSTLSYYERESRYHGGGIYRDGEKMS